MVQGIGNADYIRQGSQVTVSNQPNWSFIYRVSTVKDEKYNIGDRAVTPDGRVFRYSKAAVVCDPECGAYNGVKTIVGAVAPAQSVINGPVINQFGTNATIVAGAIGSNVVTVTVGATAGVLAGGVIALDELRGGYIVIGNGAGQHPQMRGIIGNTAVAAGGGTCDIYMDAPLIAAVVVGTTNIETMLNPYSYLTGGLTTPSGYASFLGVPAVRATAGQYFWLQTWGACWITSNSTTSDSDGARMMYFADNGSITDGVDALIESGFQIAGPAIDASSAGSSNAPMVMLQISI